MDLLLTLLTVSSLIGAPDPSTRTHAWRVVDQVSGSYRCEYACSTSAVDAARDTACIQSALDVVETGGNKWNALELPGGVCHINAPLKVAYGSTSTIGFEIYGHGPPWTRARAPIGDAQWNSDTAIRGTVIQSSLTSGTILTLGTDYTIASVDAGTDTLTLNDAALLNVNDAINIRCGAGSGPCVLPTPLAAATQYWVKTIAGDDITVSLTAGGATVDITGWAALGAVHVSNSPGGHWKLRDFAVQGYGVSTRTTVGIGLVGASGIARFDIQNVTFANLGTGLECFTCEDGVASGITFYGNGVGFWGDGNTNSNVLVGIECGANNVCATLTGSTNTFEGGTIQGSLQYGIRVLGGENRLGGIYFEDNSAVGAAISLEKADSWVLTALDAGTDVITLDGAAPADDTQVYLWADGSTSALPAAVAYGTAYFVDDSSGNTMKLRTAASPAGSYIDFATAGTVVTVPGRTRMTIVTASNGAANFVENNHYGTGDSLSVWTGGNQIDEINMAQTMKLHKGVTETRVWSAGSCTDLGAGNICETFTNGGLYYAFTGPAVASPGIFLTGSNTLRVQQTTTGGLNFSYECRDALGYCQFRDATNDVAFLTINPNGAGAPDNEVEIKAATLTVEGNEVVVGELATDIITEQVAASGVTVDGVLLKDGDVTLAASTDYLYASLIDEFPASGTGVTIDGVLCKDGDVTVTAVTDHVYTSLVDEFPASAAGVTVDGVLLKDGDVTVTTVTDHVYASLVDEFPASSAGVTVDGVLIKDGLVDSVDVSVLAAQINTCFTPVGDGVADDTAALQACIDATPHGGALFLSEGTYLITASLTAINPIYIHGTGASGISLGDQYAFGSASWASATGHGTVIKTAMTSGTMLAMENNDPHFLVKDIAFLNTAVGAHTTVGLSVSTNGGNRAHPRLENVSLANLSTGASVTGAAARMEFFYLVGNDTGLSVGCEGAVVLSPYAVLNGTAIKLLSTSVDVVIVDGYLSGNTTGLDILGARANTVIGTLFTGNTTGLLIEKSGGGGTGTGGDQNTVQGSQFITNDPVSVYGSGNHFEFTGITASPAFTLQTGAAYNKVEYLGGVGGSYTDSSGQQNFKIYQSANGLEFFDSAMVSFEDGMVTSTSATIGGASIASGDFTVAATGDFVKADIVSEFTSATGVTIDGALCKDGDFIVGSGTDYVSTDIVSEFTSAAGVTIDGVLCKDGDISTAATGDYVKTDHIEEFTAANGVKIDSSGGAGTTLTLKDGYINGIGFISQDSTCGLAITDDATDAMSLTATTLTANTTTFDVNGNLTPDKVTIMSSGGNVCRVIYSDSNAETTTTTGLETVKTLTLAAGTMAADGDRLDFDAYANCDATANNKQFDFYFNAATVETSSQNCNGNAWHLHASIWRKSSTTFDYEGSLSYATEGSGVLHAYNTSSWGAGSWADAKDFEFRLTTTDIGGAQLNGVTVTYCPAVP